jgi:hypothetical protein
LTKPTIAIRLWKISSWSAFRFACQIALYFRISQSQTL